MNYVANSIGWANYSINPIKGLCKGGCSYCYARKIYKRFKLDPEIRLDLSMFDAVSKLRKPSRIFVCSTHEIMGDWIPDEWIIKIINQTKKYPQHTFMFLSKNPKRYCHFLFPENSWIGITITGEEKNQSWLYGYTSGMNNIRFISYEPLLDKPLPIVAHWQDWIIIGALTGYGGKYQPKIEWIDYILRQTKKYNIRIPVFMKSNLKKVWDGELIQEFPKE